MSSADWSFVEFAGWLRTKSELLSAEGAVIGFEHVETGRASVRLRIENGMRLGELTVWDDGCAHMAVVDLGSNDFIYERDGVCLAKAPIEEGLGEFFKFVGSSP